jgi:hypothetical protein
VHDAATATGRNGNADIFADKSGNVHIAYGSSGFPSTATGGPRTLHYVRYAGAEKVRDVLVNEPGELQFWDPHGLGIGSVAASDDGKYVLMTYVTKDAGQLRVRLSSSVSPATMVQPGPRPRRWRAKAAALMDATNMSCVHAATRFIWHILLRIAFICAS